MDSKRLKILSLLAKHGVNEQSDISPALKEIFPGVNVHDGNAVHVQLERLKRLISGLKEDGLIKCELPHMGGGNSTQGHDWVTSIQVLAEITQKGMDELEKEKDKDLEARLQDSIISSNESSVEANNAVVRSAEYQKKFGDRSLWLAALSTLFICLTFFSQCNDGSKSEIKNLTLELKHSSEMLDSLKASLNSLSNKINQKLEIRSKFNSDTLK